MKDRFEPKGLWLSRLALLWAGIVIGCSFIATPIKFHAPSLSLSTALEVGRVTFRAMALAELALALLGMALLVSKRRVRSLFWLPIAVFLIQWLAVMPLLNDRTDALVSGRTYGGAPWHMVYIFLEIVKIGALLRFAFRSDWTSHVAN